MLKLAGNGRVQRLEDKDLPLLSKRLKSERVTGERTRSGEQRYRDDKNYCNMFRLSAGLDISYNNITDNGAAQLADLLKVRRNQQRLKRLCVCVIVC